MSYRDELQIGVGHNRGSVRTSQSLVPSDAVAMIFKPSRSMMTSGRGRARNWLLRFERRTPPLVDFLTGWTGSDDPLVQVELVFPTRAAAIAFAGRQGLNFRVTTTHVPPGGHSSGLETGWWAQP